MQSGPAAAVCTYLFSGWHIVEHQQVFRLQCRHAIAACLKVIQDSHPAYIQILLSGCIVAVVGPVIFCVYGTLSAVEEHLQESLLKLLCCTEAQLSSSVNNMANCCTLCKGCCQ